MKKLLENKEIVILNKPQGLATGIGKQKCFCKNVFVKFPNLKEVNGYKKEEGGLLNRLDNETGGLIMFAKNDQSFEKWKNLMKDCKVEKYYIAVVEGLIKEKKGYINKFIGHKKGTKKKMIVKGKGIIKGKWQEAETIYEVIPKNKKNLQEVENLFNVSLKKISDNYTILKVMIKKGKRHQIRLHLASIKHPIIGDKIYNKNKATKFSNHLLYFFKIKCLNINLNLCNYIK